jgi:Tfp pilus assembly protein PilX
MRNTPLSSRHQQRGAILVIALIFLITITLYTISSMRSSNLGLFMAQNEESRVSATQGAQALADAIVASPASTPVVGDSGYTVCTAGETGCSRYDLPVTDPTLQTAVANNYVNARVGPMTAWTKGSATSRSPKVCLCSCQSNKRNIE